MNTEILAFEMPGLNVHIHQHAGYQLVYAFDQPFNTELAGQRHDAIRGFLIKPQLPHACTRVSGKFFIANIEPDSAAGNVIDKALEGEDIKLIREPEDVYNILGVTKGDGSPIYDGLALLRATKSTDNIDPRIQQVMDMIREMPSCSLLPDTLAASIHISTSRLTALFKEQTGSSLSKFMLWARLRHAILKLVKEDTSLTEIAVQTGFYDSSNFTKYMHEMIGVPPMAFRKNRRVIKIL
jgi:AraC-like DNA-binding protein